jgi:cobalt-zinc-cadmium efflux system protein
MVGSLAVIAAGAVVYWTEFAQADAIASLGIAAFIAPRAYLLLKDVLAVLLEATPAGVDLAVVRRHLEESPGVEAVHDLHAWSITSGLPVLSAHIVVAPEVFSPEAYHALLDHLADCLAGHFDVEHSTFQFEPASHTEPALHP